MQIGVSSYSFSRLVNSGAMAQLAVIGAAKDLGFEVIEFSTIAVPAGKTLPGFAKELRAESERVGLPIANYTIGADFLRGSGGDLAAEIARVRTEVDIAVILGAPGMRHDATGGYPADHVGPRSFDSAVARLAEGCRAVTEYAAERGIKTMVENHGYFCQDSERCEKLVNAVAHPNFGLLVDIGNFTCADEDPTLAIGRLAPYAIHAHAKDFHIRSGSLPTPGEGWFPSRATNYLRGAIIGHGDVPLVQCIRTLRRNGYDGVLSIEFEGMEDVLTGIRIGRDNLARLVAAAG
ncbi:MAG: sugar phosphate isomerase/epimerase [Armatimonadetes bacterium]|nr:sugar phosphate isomerase/epimerase [Armatimonadota bacterium]